MKILIVDNDKDSRELLTKAFQKREHIVTAVIDPDAALNVSRTNTPDLILSDISVADIDGYELCRRFRANERFRAIPFLLFSGDAPNKSDIEYARSVGVSKFMLKTLEPEELAKEVERYLTRAGDKSFGMTGNVIELKTALPVTNTRLLAGVNYNRARLSANEAETSESREEQLHLITDSLPELMAEVDKDCRYLFVNRSYAKTFGFLQKTVKGVHVRDVVGKSAYAVIQPRLRQAMKGETVAIKAWLQIGPAGSRYVWFRLVPRTNTRNEVVAVVIIMSDITHLHLVETALQEREMLLSSLLASAPLMLFAVSIRGIVTVSEGAGLKLLDKQGGSDVGQPVAEVFAKYPQLLENIERALSGERFESELLLNKQELKLSFTPQNDVEGKLIGTVCVAIDESERARLEREVVSVSTLEQERIGQDLHDSLGQILTGIGLLGKALEKKLLNANSPVSEDARTISELASEATRLAKQAVTGLLPVVTEEHGLQMALEDLLHKTEELHGIRCELRLDADLDEMDYQYATQIYLILSEAVSNSIKHADPGRIEVGCRKTEDGYAFYAVDSGNKKKKPSINSGGMGLNIMKHRSRVIGAALKIDWLESGTRVTCLLPALAK